MIHAGFRRPDLHRAQRQSCSTRCSSPKTWWATGSGNFPDAHVQETRRPHRAKSGSEVAYASSRDYQKHPHVRAENARSGAPDPGVARVAGAGGGSRSLAPQRRALRGQDFESPRLPTRKTTKARRSKCCASRKAVAQTATTLKRFTPKARGSAGPDP